MIKELSPANIVLGYDKSGEPVTLINISENPVEGWSEIVRFTPEGSLAFWTARLYDKSIPRHKAFMSVKVKGNFKPLAVPRKPIHYFN